MSWNRPSEERSIAKCKDERKRFCLRNGIIALIAFIFCAAGVLWFVFSEEGGKRVAPNLDAQRMIREVTPAKVAQKNAQSEKDEHSGMVKFKGKWYPKYNSKGGRIWLSPKGVRYHTPRIYTNDLTKAYMRKELTYFDTECDREIASLISTPLGAMRIGPRNPYDKSFEKEFLASLKVPIIIGHDDPENIKILKRSVIETKADLKARMDAGEDIVAILNDTNKKMKELALYKNELKHLADQEAMKAGSAEEAKDVYEAANKMLAERGVSPLKMTGLLHRKFQYQNSTNQHK